MSYNFNGFVLPKAMVHNQSVLDKMVQNTALMNSIIKPFSVCDSLNFSGITSSLNCFSNILSQFSSVTVPNDALINLSSTTKALPVLRIQGVAETILPRVIDSLSGILIEPIGISKIATADWSWVSRVCEEIEDSEDKDKIFDNDLITDDIRDEMGADISDILSNPEQAQELSKSKYVLWKEKHPLLADLFAYLLWPLIVGLLLLACESRSGTTIKETNVYIEPNSNSTVVYNIDGDNNILVVEDVPYYYRVEFLDIETDKTITGYVYKGNIVLDESGEICNDDSTPDSALIISNDKKD